MNSVCVLLSTYNGEKYLTPLLDSVVSQKGVALSVVARDDGSKDNTPSILSRYKEQGKITRLITDSNVGFARSFHRLCTEAVPSDYYAFCDQDDIWDSRQTAVCGGKTQRLPQRHSAGVLVRIPFNRQKRQGIQTTLQTPHIQKSVQSAGKFFKLQRRQRLYMRVQSESNGHDSDVKGRLLPLP